VRAEVEVPAAWGARFAVNRVTLIVEFGADGSPVGGRGMRPEPGGRTFTGTVPGPGAYAALLVYAWDGRERTFLERFRVDGAQETLVLLRPRIESPDDLPPPDLVRLEVSVVDERGEAVVGAALSLLWRSVRDGRGSWSRVAGTWTSDARGEAVLDVPTGNYRVTASRAGFGTVEARLGAAEPRATVVLPSAKATLRVRLVREGPPSREILVVHLRSRALPTEGTWQPTDQRVVDRPSADLAFPVPERWEHLVLVTGRDVAPAAVRVPAFPEGVLERAVELVVGPGEDVGVRGLEGVDLPAGSRAMIQYEGPIGEVLTDTPDLRLVAGTWRILRVAAAPGKVSVRVGDRDYRGTLPAAGADPRGVELR
jgi:hypothetical protein